MSDYKSTLNLPATSFPMKANLREREPKTLAFWAKAGAYGRMVAANAANERYVLHDGPPYANGHIHMGTALNKVLKDIIVKSRNMQGYKAEYVPGWDCHGLPIEHKVAQELKDKGKTDVPAPAVRRICREYAAKWLKTQREEFKRLGVMGVWDEPYQTMSPVYEAATARALGDFMASGGVYRGKKPIHWCCSCETALAEAEVEYADHASPSIFVAFRVDDPALAERLPQAAGLETYAVIWTTTPWTIPSNMAVAAHPDFEYALVQAGGTGYIVARELLEPLAKRFGWDAPRILATLPGSVLEGLQSRHPLYDRPSPLVLANYVTLDAGTGLVHTAPGHGREDYDTGLKYGLEVLSPLDDQGRYLPSMGELAGKTVFEANPLVMDMLRARGALLAQDKVAHSYPHCWRCKQPVIFRATTQWFISMEKNGLRAKALEAIGKDVSWVPAWGRERIHGMIENRPDWCISRQRTWGVPIVALICAGCDAAWHDPAWVYDIVDRFEKHPRGCDYWFEADMTEIVPSGLTCPHCGGTHWDKEDDILDVWFDSGTSFAAVLEKRPECRFPADLYLEGSDQHRGWFHSSLLAAMGARGVAPYKTVLTHGYVVDGDGRKMSKSLGNTIAPQEVIDKFGAEVLRLWVSAVNYQEDIRISDEILNRQVDAYRRIRNTCRFLLSNLADFAPDKAVAFADMNPLDRYALDLIRQALERVAEAYRDFEFHKVYHTLHNLCVTDLSAFYLDVVKDRLYVLAPGDKERRAAQTVLWKALMGLIQAMAPILSFTAEEVFQALPPALKAGPLAEMQTVFELRFSFGPDERLTHDQRDDLAVLGLLRAEVQKATEPLRKAGAIGHSLDTRVTLYAPDDLLAELIRLRDNPELGREGVQGLDLRELLIVSQVALGPAQDAPASVAADAALHRSESISGLSIVVDKAPGAKCQRCWVYDPQTGADPHWPDACPRCVAVLNRLPKAG